MIALSMVMFTGCEDVDKSDDIPAIYSDVENLIDRGFQAFNSGEFSDAVNYFNQALERDVEPDSIGIIAYQGLGWTYSRIGNYSSAITNFNFLLAIESLESGKYPVVEEENLIATSNAYTTEDTAGVGPWSVEMPGDKYIVSVNSVSSYSAEVSARITVGSRPNEIEPGTAQFKLDNAPLSNTAGTGVGTPLSSALAFIAGTNTEADSLVYPLVTADSLDQGFDFGDSLAVELAEYHVDPLTGTISIKPRFWTIEKLTAVYKYFENKYVVRQHDFHTVSLLDILEDDSPFPVVDVENYSGDAQFLVGGEFFDKTGGGTYLQCDAFAGIAASYLAQKDYPNAIKAANVAVLINEYLNDQGSPYYPYSRNLYDGDNSFDMWNVYQILAQSYISARDFRNAEKCLETSMGLGNLLEASSGTYEFDMIQLMGTATKPDSWSPPHIW